MWCLPTIDVRIPAALGATGSHDTSPQPNFWNSENPYNGVKSDSEVSAGHGLGTHSEDLFGDTHILSPTNHGQGTSSASSNLHTTARAANKQGKRIDSIAAEARRLEDHSNAEF